ncbi:hypothetical protein REPUB_Repub05bG0113500 [Reevesia pubescens]
MPGRPKNKRLRDEGESTNRTRLSRRERKMRCQKCFHQGHNSRSCPNNKNEHVS